MIWYDTIWYTSKLLYALLISLPYPVPYIIPIQEMLRALYFYAALQYILHSTRWQVCSLMQTKQPFLLSDEGTTLLKKRTSGQRRPVNSTSFSWVKSFSPSKSTLSLRVYGKAESMTWKCNCSPVKNSTQARERRWEPSSGTSTERCWYIPQLEVQRSMSAIITLH
jgi:hypothetical protein